MEENDKVLCAHYAKMLGLTGNWKVSGVDLSLSEKRLELEVKWEGSGALCPQCGQNCSRYDVAEERRWRHLDAMGFETVIRSRVPRANCAEHGVLQMKVPWAGTHGRFTLAFEAFAIKVLLASRSVKAACELLGLSWQAAHQIMERAVERGLDARVLEGLRIVGMDEKSFLAGQSYASLLYEVDPQNSRVLEVMMDRDGDAAELLKEAQGVFKKWYAWAIRCRLHEIKKVARMLKSHLDGLLNFVFFPITNAVAEGFNSKIQSLKADARGFRNFLNYRIRILFFCGKLNLLPPL